MLPIAVVGMACRFPVGPEGPSSFFDALLAGRDGVGPVPPARFVTAEARAGFGAFLPDVRGFDAGFFRVPPAEAQRMDPQQRLLLELAWEALERALIPPASLAGSATSVHVGISSSDYGRLQSSVPGANDAYAMTGGARSIAANRLSYALDLRGPSLAVDTACSSSLVALHLACQALETREADVALAGGVNLLLAEAISAGMARLGALSPTGRVRAFDAKGDGYVRGEGAGLVVLKRLDDALAAEDPIVAVIVGSAVNQDGRTNGLTAPSRQAQEAVIRDAWRRGAVDPSTVAFVEAHGTGTLLGDPIEARALGATYGAQRQAPLWLGAVKTNVGHLEAAAGIAGFIKAALALQRRVLPPNLHFQTPNPHVDLQALRLAVPTATTPLPADGVVRAAVSSFGFGGTNAHVVLEAPPVRRAPPPRAPAATELLLTSGRDLPGARAQAAAWLSSPVPLGAKAATCATARTHFDGRRALLVSAADGALLRALEGRRDSGTSPVVAFAFAGQGGQWLGMARGLAAASPVFAERLAAALRALDAGPDSHVAKLLDGSAGPTGDSVDVVQPALFALQVALAAELAAWGVVPSVVVGHSLGEVAAAVCAGALSLEDGARVVRVRSALLAETRGQGAMLAVESSVADAEQLCAQTPGRLVVAAENGPRAVVLSGDVSAVEHAQATLAQRGVFSRRVRVDVASHGPHMAPLAPRLAAGLSDLTPRTPSVRWVSTVEPSGASPSADGAYWARNLAQRVRFLEATTAWGQPTAVVEVGPHPVLSFGLEQRRGAVAGPVTCPLERDVDAERSLLATLGALWTVGVPVDFSRRWSRRDASPAAPTSTFVRQPYWYDAPLPTARPAPAASLAQRLSAAAPGERQAIAEAAVADEVAELLGLTEPPPLDVPLTAVGLDSLVGVRLCAWAEQTAQRPLPLGQVLPAGTARSVARALLGDGPAAALVTSERLGEGERWVVLHPAGFPSTDYAALAAGRMLEVLTLNVEQAPNLAALVDAVRAHLGPNGLTQRSLAGWSLGAAVAHAVARSLERESKGPRRVVLVDPIVLGREAAAPAPASLFGFLSLRCAAERVAPPTPAELDGDERHVLATFAGQRRAGPSLELLEAGLAQYRAALRRAFELVRAYAVEPLRAPVTVLHAATRPPGEAAPPSLGWAGLGAGARWKASPGDHYSLLRTPTLLDDHG